MKSLRLSDYLFRTYDKIRYSDTDRQGHVNNAVFSQLLETGRVEILYSLDQPILSENASFIIASSNTNLIAELNWPGIVDIGTGIAKIGTSSITVYQGLFQDGTLLATAETVIVQVDNENKKSKPLTEEAKKNLKTF